MSDRPNRAAPAPAALRRDSRADSLLEALIEHTAAALLEPARGALAAQQGDEYARVYLGPGHALLRAMVDPARVTTTELARAEQTARQTLAHELTRDARVDAASCHALARAQAQCAVGAFVEALQAATARSPQLTLDAQRASDGNVITRTMTQALETGPLREGVCSPALAHALRRVLHERRAPLELPGGVQVSLAPEGSFLVTLVEADTAGVDEMLSRSGLRLRSPSLAQHEREVDERGDD